ncbi:MAG: metallophosphoesterase family protein [Planctomycetes bacterium]|nr:metallophosphoesterase family protein [Planctomycetota bacterium]
MFAAEGFAFLFFLAILPLTAAGILGVAAWRRMLRAFRRSPGRLGAVAEVRFIRLSAAGIAALYLIAAGYGFFIEPEWPEVERTSLRVPSPVLGLGAFKIVHLSDLHLERLGARERRILRRVRDERPDAVVLTGDYANRREAIPALVEFLRSLKARHGVYGVEGHVDHKFEIREAFRAAGAVLLRDEFVFRTDGSSRPLLIAGMSMYPSRPLPEILEAAPEEGFRVLLHHAPQGPAVLGSARVDLFLCGHTHGGQVRLPGTGSRNPFRPESPLPDGVSVWDGVTCVVNRGLGTWGGPLPAIRFLARPEVRVIELRPAAPD